LVLREMKERFMQEATEEQLLHLPAELFALWAVIPMIGSGISTMNRNAARQLLIVKLPLLILISKIGIFIFPLLL